MPAESLRILAVVTDDQDLVRAVERAFHGETRVAKTVVRGGAAGAESAFRANAPTVVVADVGAGDEAAVDGLRRIVRAADGAPTVVVADRLTPEVARACVRLRLADLLVKPVGETDLVRAVLRSIGEEEEGEAPASQIHTFLPATGGAGNTTLAIQTAFLLHDAAPATSRGRRMSTCVVDLNLQHGACAEYLDLEPRFDIAEIENSPDRLDRQLLETMLSRHASGLAVVSAPPCPWEMRSFRADLVTRLLDLVATYFDTVVIDLPRTWFPWTDSILGGSDRIFVVTEATVPALRHTQRVTGAIRERLGTKAPVSVVVNRFDVKGPGATLRESDIREVLGETYGGRVANNYRIVRQALDRGVPVRDVMKGCDVLADLERIVLPEGARQREAFSLKRAAVRLLGGRLAAAAR